MIQDSLEVVVPVRAKAVRAVMGEHLGVLSMNKDEEVSIVGKFKGSLWVAKTGDGEIGFVNPSNIFLAEDSNPLANLQLLTSSSRRADCCEHEENFERMKIQMSFLLQTNSQLHEDLEQKEAAWETTLEQFSTFSTRQKTLISLLHKSNKDIALEHNVLTSELRTAKAKEAYIMELVNKLKEAENMQKQNSEKFQTMINKLHHTLDMLNQLQDICKRADVKVLELKNQNPQKDETVVEEYEEELARLKSVATERDQLLQQLQEEQKKVESLLQQRQHALDLISKQTQEIHSLKQKIQEFEGAASARRKPRNDLLLEREVQELETLLREKNAHKPSPPKIEVDIDGSS